LSACLRRLANPSSGVREFGSEDRTILHPPFRSVNHFAGLGEKCDRRPDLDAQVFHICFVRSVFGLCSFCLLTRAKGG
jgi:hypothetical protein